MKSYYKIWGIVVCALLAGLLVWYFFLRTTVKPAIIQSEHPVYGYIAQSVTATGKIEPVDTVTVGSQVSGIIKSLYVDFNSQVRKGELLAELDRSLLQATLDQFNGNLQSALSQRLYAENNFARQDELFKADAISKAEHDIALNTLNSAKAAVKSVAAQVRSAKKNLSYTAIYSPIDGVVLNRNVNIGQTVAASFSTPTLFVIAKDITKMEVDANVDEADIGEVRAGERSIFTVDAFINDQFIGTVKDIRLRPSVSANVVTYTTIINAANDDRKLKPGMTANIVIYTKEVEHALLIPAKALMFTPDSALKVQYQLTGSEGYQSKARQQSSSAKTSAITAVKVGTDTTGSSAIVWLLKGKKLVLKHIKIGLNDNTQVEVLSGLTLADLVVTGVVASGALPAAKATTTSGSPFLPKQPARGGRAR
ncbi:efflux transporter periplasmic adaptor subunit [Mucilaginibacter sp. PAMC 26640]|nr:efflux transporter periplasmic adaptor subunit [Mucilaginibacter sp. PAMC 26640]